MINKFSAYDVIMYPMEKHILRKARQSLISQVHGRVLEVGAGTGANLAFYSFHNIEQLSLVDLSLHPRVTEHPYPQHISVEFSEGRMESLPYPDQQFDYVVVTLVLCSVNDTETSLQEVYRVLKPGGTLVFIEHVSPHHPALKGIFDRLTPAWRRVAHNCHLNRKTLESIEIAGFISIELYPVYKDIFIGGTARKP